MGLASSKPVKLLLTAAVSSAAGQSATGLSGVIQQLAHMRDSVQQLHDHDAESYNKASCHCEKETNRLSSESDGAIPRVSGEIQENAATIQDRAAFIERSQADLAQNKKELADYEKNEKDQKTAWVKREAQLTADINEVTQATNALAAAQTYLGDHPEIISLVQDMNKDATESLKNYNRDLANESGARAEQHETFLTNSENEKSQIKQGKIDIFEADSKKSKATENMLTKDKEVKGLTQDLNDLVAFCETQALDWDKQSAKRQEDFNVLNVAMNVLTCGKEDCSSLNFLQVRSGINSKRRMKFSKAAQKNTIRNLARLGAKTGNKDLMLLQQLLKRDPLIGAKNLIRKIIEKLTTEGALDQGEMNMCSTQVAECKTKRDFAMDAVSKHKLSLEELSASMEEDKAEFKDKAIEWKHSTDEANHIGHIDIPDLVANYDDTKTKLTEEKNNLAHAILVLRKHFGVSDNNLHTGAVDSSTGKDGAPERQVNNAGETQSTGASVVNMLQKNLDERKDELGSLRENHIAELDGYRKQKSDQGAISAGAKTRYEYLKNEIAEETALFQEKLMQMQGSLDAAASHGRCVQKLEPCGVQMDKRAQRETELKSLKEAWTILGGSDDDRPAHW